MKIPLSPPATRHSIEASLTAPMVETHAIVEVRAYDCRRQPASGVQLEIWRVSDAGYRACTNCRILYPAQTGEPTPGLALFSSSVDAPAWTVLTAGDEVVFIARQARTRRVVSVLGPITMRAGSLYVGLAPASRADLEALSDEIGPGAASRSGP